MLNRREFLERSLKGSSLIALGSSVPGFLASAARAAPASKDDTILVVIELNGGNDGLNTVIPFGDDLYHKARPTLRYKNEELIKVDDHLGLNPALASFERYFGNGQLAVVQGVGYPNPNRSHFDSMDIWQSADLTGKKLGNGWLGRTLNAAKVSEGAIPGVYLGAEELPLALQGSAQGIASVHPNKSFDLHLGNRLVERVYSPEEKVPTEEKPRAEDKRVERRRQLIQELTRETPAADNLLPFVQRSALQTYSSIDKLRDLVQLNDNAFRFRNEVARRRGELARNLGLVARMIQSGFNTRIFYVSIGSFDTHSKQKSEHEKLLRILAEGIATFFNQLDPELPGVVYTNYGQEEDRFFYESRTASASKEDKDLAQRVVVLTFSEFGRRVDENGSLGTDHGAASCLFLAGPKVKGGVVGKHPSLSDLGDGDLKYHTDFRQVYATLLDKWLHCDSQAVLGGKFAHLPLLK
ncbi:MAG: DUF1501 domain-containing protein [Gemmataceae bacterium]